MLDLTGQQLDQYRLLQRVGSGSISTVYKAYDVERRRVCAVKVLGEEYCADFEIVNQFRQGGILGANLHSPFIVEVYRIGEANGFHYIASAFLDGGTLERRIRPGRPWRLPEAVKVLRQIAQALDFAHRSAIVHRDVKPGNILFAGHRGPAVLSDFGIAVSTIRQPTRGPDLSGTVPYMAPEQCRGEPPGPAVDNYALAVIAYRLLTGRLPFEAEDPLTVMYQQIREPVPLPSTINPALSPAVEQVLLRGLAKDPGARYPTANALVDALEGKKAQAGVREPKLGATPPPRPRGNWSPSSWPGLLVGLALLGGGGYGGWWAWQQAAPPPIIVVETVLYVTATPAPTSTPSATSTVSPRVAPTGSTGRVATSEVAAGGGVVEPVTASPTRSTPPSLPKAECAHPQIADITSPRQGQEIRGPVAIIGTAGGPDFVSYELKYKRPDERGEPHQYAGLSWNVPQANAELAIWSPNIKGGPIAPGPYDIFLVVKDRTGNDKRCAVRIVLK